jgi:hypothetical protein
MGRWLETKWENDMTKRHDDIDWKTTWKGRVALVALCGGALWTTGCGDPFLLGFENSRDEAAAPVVEDEPYEGPASVQEWYDQQEYVVAPWVRQLRVDELDGMELETDRVLFPKLGDRDFSELEAGDILWAPVRDPELAFGRRIMATFHDDTHWVFVTRPVSLNEIFLKLHFETGVREMEEIVQESEGIWTPEAVGPHRQGLNYENSAEFDFSGGVPLKLSCVQNHAILDVACTTKDSVRQNALEFTITPTMNFKTDLYLKLDIDEPWSSPADSSGAATMTVDECACFTHYASAKGDAVIDSEDESAEDRQIAMLIGAWKRGGSKSYRQGVDDQGQQSREGAPFGSCMRPSYLLEGQYSQEIRTRVGKMIGELVSSANGITIGNETDLMKRFAKRRVRAGSDSGLNGPLVDEFPRSTDELESLITRSGNRYLAVLVREQLLADVRSRYRKVKESPVCGGQPTNFVYDLRADDASIVLDELSFQMYDKLQWKPEEFKTPPVALPVPVTAGVVSATLQAFVSGEASVGGRFGFDWKLARPTIGVHDLNLRIEATQAGVQVKEAEMDWRAFGGLASPAMSVGFEAKADVFAGLKVSLALFGITGPYVKFGGNATASSSVSGSVVFDADPLDQDFVRCPYVMEYGGKVEVGLYEEETKFDLPIPFLRGLELRPKAWTSCQFDTACMQLKGDPCSESANRIRIHSLDMDSRVDAVYLLRAGKEGEDLPENRKFPKNVYVDGWGFVADSHRLQDRVRQQELNRQITLDKAGNHDNKCESWKENSVSFERMLDLEFSEIQKGDTLVVVRNEFVRAENSLCHVKGTLDVRVAKYSDENPGAPVVAEGPIPVLRMSADSGTHRKVKLESRHFPTAG